MKSEAISFSSGDRVQILPTPLNQAKQERNEFPKLLEFSKEYEVAEAHRVWDVWKVKVYLNAEKTETSSWIKGDIFSKK